MNHQLWLIWVFLRRDLMPASTGNGPRRRFSYRFLIGLLPGICMWSLWLVGTFVGVAIHVESRRLQQVSDTLIHSPYHALFVAGSFQTGAVPSHQQQRTRAAWLAQRDPVTQKKFFTGVYPYHKTALHVQGEADHFEYQKGLALVFEAGPLRYDTLLEAICRDNKLEPARLDAVAAGAIIVTEAAWRRWGGVDGQTWLSVHHPTRNEWVPLHVAAIVTALPHRFDYLLSHQRYQQLRSDYYDQNITRLFWRQPNQQIGDAAWLGPHIADRAEREEHGLTLPLRPHKPLPRGVILQRAVSAGLAPDQLNLGAFRPQDLVSFSGAAFQFNPDLHHTNTGTEQPTWIIALAAAFEAQNMRVQENALAMLAGHFHVSSYFGRLQRLTWWVLPMVPLLLWVLFGLSLHTRLHRLAVLRMAGLSTWQLGFFYFFQGLCISVIGSVAAIVGVGKLLTPTLTTLSIPWFVLGTAWLSTASLFALTTIAMLRALDPADMIHYRL